MIKALLLSNSTTTGTKYLQWCKNKISEFFKGRNNIIFIPYAAVAFSFENYEENVKKALGPTGGVLTSIHRFTDKKPAIEKADGIIVGGGNTFALKKRLEDHNIFKTIQNRVLNHEIPYCGWSAGANLGSLSIKTTNDMPITRPQTFEAFKLVNFQINPHYICKKDENHNGETRDERLIEFSILNPEIPCLAIPEGTGILKTGDHIEYFGEKNARIFYGGELSGTVQATKNLIIP